MLDLDEFVHECQSALREAHPPVAVKEVLERVVADSTRVAELLPPLRAGIVPLHVSPTLTVLQVVWAPGMSFRPHNHLMWAAIGLYAGQEDNTLYRRAHGGLVISGGRELRTGDCAVFGGDAIHSVTNPLDSFTGALHVYGGDLPATSGRSEWDADTFVEIPYDFARTVQYFEDANREAAT
jgi:predicted metal-dependent enzyme (double-stranded beta helix superfamily)